MKLKKIMSKKGQLGLDVAKSFVMALFTLSVIAFGLLIAMNSLNASTAGTADTASVLANVSAGTTSLFSNAGTWFSLVAVVVIILIISVVIMSVNRFGATSG